MNLDLAGLKVAGLTGGIATGKSTVADMLAQAGATILDADRIAHNVYAPGQQAWQDIVDYFGESILSARNEIDRQALGSIVFRDPETKEALDRIVHPRVLEVMQEEILQMAVTCPEDLVVLDVGGGELNKIAKDQEEFSRQLQSKDHVVEYPFGLYSPE